MMEVNWIFIPLLLAVGVLLLYWEWKQYAWKRMHRKLLLLGILLCLYALKFPPKVDSNQKLGPTIVVTPGVTKDQLDSITKSIPNVQMISLIDSSAQPFAPKRLLHFPDSLYKKAVQIAGYGLHKEDLVQLTLQNKRFLDIWDFIGISQLKWQNNTVLAGESNGLQLEIFGADQDSVVVTFENRSKTIQAKSQVVYLNPLQPGLSEVDLKYYGAGKLLQQYILPVSVKAKKTLSVVAYQTSPSYEMNTLIKLLAEEGHYIRSKVKIARDKHRYNYFNGAERPYNTFNTTLLEQSNMLVLDGSYLQQLSIRTIERLSQFIKNGGVMVVLHPVNSNNLNLLASSKIEVGTKVKEYALEANGASVQFFSVNQNPSYNKKMGNGGLVVVGLENSYLLNFKGLQEAYASLWNGLLADATEQKQQQGYFSSNNNLSNTRISLLVEAEVNPRTIRKALGPNLHIQEQLGTNITSIDFYTDSIGWNSFKTDGDTLQVHVADRSQPNIPYFRNLQLINKNFGFSTNPDKMPTDNTNFSQPINKYFFYMILLLCFAILWVEPKLI